MLGELLVNLLRFGQAAAGAEVLALAARAGIDPERVRSAMSHSAGASRFMDREAHALWLATISSRFRWPVASRSCTR